MPLKLKDEMGILPGFAAEALKQSSIERINCCQPLKALLANHWSSKGRDQKIQMKSIQKELQDRKNHRVERIDNGEHHVSNDFQCLEALRVEANLEL